MVPSRMITTEGALQGYEITASLGPVEGTAEVAMRGVAVSHLEIHEGGKLQDLVWSARQNVAAAAGELGADAIVGLRYVVAGRDYEKSVLAFGTAVTCTKARVEGKEL